MAYARIVRGGDSWFRLEIRDLEYPARDYDEFEITLTDRNGNDLYEEYWSHNTPAHYTFREIWNPPVNGFVYVYTRARHKGRWWSSGDTSYTFAGNEVIYPPDDLSGLTVNSVGTNTIDVSWRRSSGADYYDVYLDGRYYGNTDRTYMDVRNLSSGVRYSIRVEPVKIWGGEEYVGRGESVTATTKTNAPGGISGLKVVNQTSTSASISWNRATNATGYRIYLDGEQVTTTTSTSYTYYGLKPDTFYSLMVIPYNSSGTGNGESVPVITTSDRPENFQWSYPKTSGEPVYRTVIIDGKPRAQILVAWEWNNFTDRINEFREYKGKSKYSFTRAVTNQPFKKSYLDEARSAIYAINSYVPSIKSKSYVMAEDFNNLRDSLNEIK